MNKLSTVAMRPRSARTVRFALPFSIVAICHCLALAGCSPSKPPPDTTKFIASGGSMTPKHKLFVTIDLGSRAGPVEPQFDSAFSTRLTACRADGVILDLPRPDGHLSLEPFKPLDAAEIRRRAIDTSADGILDIRLVNWSSHGKLSEDPTAPILYGRYTIQATLSGLSGPAEWKAILTQEIINGAGGDKLATALIQRLAQDRALSCPVEAVP